jgi:hypothetical protein
MGGAAHDATNGPVPGVEQDGLLERSQNKLKR